MKPRSNVNTEKKKPAVRRAASNGEKRPVSRRTSPTLDQIAVRAYEIWEARAGAPGSELEDWLRAEHELSRPQARKTS